MYQKRSFLIHVQQHRPLPVAAMRGTSTHYGLRPATLRSKGQGTQGSRLTRRKEGRPRGRAKLARCDCLKVVHPERDWETGGCRPSATQAGAPDEYSPLAPALPTCGDERAHWSPASVRHRQDADRAGSNGISLRCQYPISTGFSHLSSIFCSVFWPLSRTSSMPRASLFLGEIVVLQE